ncbi:MAG TPA: HEAT repeat domain-containing protein [Vicinamibacteria bacterium]|nr:HEAT repeat domain-containing protein [Vicinamibacteria bacterium]
MSARATFALLAPLALAASPLAAATIKEVKLADGREPVNAISSPLFDTASVGSLRIASFEGAYDKKAKIVRRTGGFMTKGPQYDLDPAINLGDLLAEALRSEAAAMGFRLSSGEDFVWSVKGTLKDIYVESRQVPYGATQFWGYMDVEFEVQKAGETPASQRLRTHKYYGAYNAGFGRKDEATEGLTHLLVEGAQEMLARLNRQHFKAPTHPDMEAKAKVVGPGQDKRHDLYLVGLSGAAGATPVLMSAIPAVKDENDRAAMIEALGHLGKTEAIAFLAGRYATEDEDCRWETLRAMDTIGGQEALAVVAKGTKDENEACRRLTARILGAPAK